MKNNVLSSTKIKFTTINIENNIELPPTAKSDWKISADSNLLICVFDARLQTVKYERIYL